MDYTRFGRLNSKKIEELLKNNSPVYEMGKFFPYLTTRSKAMDQRHTISSFKTLLKRFRYCYSLYDNCKAVIKQKGLDYEEKCDEIDNKVYVFTDIPYDDFDHLDWELLYDKEELIAVQENSSFSEQTKSVLTNMQKRKLSPSQYNYLRKYLSQTNFVSLKSEYIGINDLEKGIFNEFIWRMALYGKGIYKESEIREVSIKKTRSRIQDAHSLFKNFDRYGSLEYIHSFTEKLNDLMISNQKETANKLFSEFLEENDNTFLLNEFTGIKLLENSIPIYEDKMVHLNNLKKNYMFLENPYSKKYKTFFRRREKAYSLFRAQQIMRKLKHEYNSIDNMTNSLQDECNKIVNSLPVINKAIENYKKDLGENQLPNQGFGYLGDGWYDDENPDDLSTQMRVEKWCDIEHERMDREKWQQVRWEDEQEYYEIQENIERLVDNNQPLDLFEYREDQYFNHYSSISIIDVLNIKELDVIDNISLEGEFFSLEEINDWLGKRLFHFSFLES